MTVAVVLCRETSPPKSRAEQRSEEDRTCSSSYFQKHPMGIITVTYIGNLFPAQNLTAFNSLLMSFGDRWLLLELTSSFLSGKLWWEEGLLPCCSSFCDLSHYSWWKVTGNPFILCHSILQRPMLSPQLLYLSYCPADLPKAVWCCPFQRHMTTNFHNFIKS